MGDGDEELKGSSSSRSANAEARMRFASVDALSELVWSPRNGLTLRCADFSFTGKRKLLSPNFFDHIGPTKNEEEAAGFSVDLQLRTRDRAHDEAWVEDMKLDSTRSLGSPRGTGGETEAMLANEPLRLERAGSQDEETNRALDADCLEATDENNLATLAVVACESKGECLPEDQTDAGKAGPSGSYGRRGKATGKEKALSDGDEESFGSVESCNSAGLLLRGKKRPGFEQQLILGSKRLKTLNQECLGSTSKLNQDSSFMNWISNMSKGIWKGNEEDKSPFVNAQQQLSPCCLKENSGCRNTGFQSFFQSIYCPKKRDQDALEMDSSNDANVASLQELPWIPDHCLNTKGDHFNVVFNQTSETLSSGNKHEPNISLLSPSKSKRIEEQNTCNEADEKVTKCVTNRNSGLESLWISRFASKSSFPQKKHIHERITNDSSSDVVKTQNAILPIVSSLRIESSEAMSSLFARRLEAMKHIMPSGSLAEEGQTNLICFFCGKKGHRLQDCLEVTDTELRDLVQNISARNGREAASSLCIRCFQLSHWAATCPNAPGAEDRAIKHALASTSGTKLPFSGFTDVPKEVFDAVQVLRLTRTDVLKWINTNKSLLGLEGFFLRLRLGKWEEGLGGTGYHVARIEGATDGQSSRKHSVNSSISVKVGGMTCFVESQFISNQDFLEEEFMAWWRSAGKSAGRSGGDGFPSAEELGRKIQQRKMLGF